MSDQTSERKANQLIHETSPYLLQHAYNPVDWYPWNTEALNRSKQENKPILLSVGYSACHWCHVMEHESFENDAIANLMNDHFINIKVDREERPDIDEIYMQATVAMNQGHGGWPMTVFLTPDQEPIFAGTYFPPTDKWGRPGFSTVLKNIAAAWDKDRESIVKQATHFTSRLRESIRVTSPMTVGQTEIETAVEQYAQDFDPTHGGFGQAPKFPPATGLSFLLRQYQQTKDEHTLRIVRKTLDAMAAGGLYDHIGGGFARYSTDARWLVPHFEKMLYDNALLARTYVEAYQATQEEYYRRIATETLDYILREMTSPEGGFYSATDADSEGVEGKFFVWTPQQIRSIVVNQEDAKRFCAYYDITDEGNWEHQSIPNTPKTIEQVAKEVDCSTEELWATIERVRPLVYQARLQRIPPGLDDKVITAWNGMMIGAMAEAARILGHQRYLDAAQRAADFLLTTLTQPGNRLLRTYREGKAHLDACLEDYAYLAEALIDVYEAGASERYLYEAVSLAERILEDFADHEHGGFFTTSIDHESLILRSREGPDGATPSGNAVASSALARLSFHFNRDDFREAATKAIRAYGHHISQIPRGYAKSLLVVDLLLHGPIELALVGHVGESSYEALSTEIHRHFIPNRIFAHQNNEDAETTHPLLRDKTLIEGKAALYLCRNFACEAPITDPHAIAPALTQQQEPAKNDTSESLQTLKTRGLSGQATPGGTATYVARILASPSPTRPIGQSYAAMGATGLTTSRIGFGGYRIDIAADEHRHALTQALREGCNLIDTSTNYADGGSERLVGSVLSGLIKANELTREEVIVVSKIGYVQGQNLKRAEAREKAGNPFPDMVKYGEGIWHCLHPDFLDEQLTLSLDRLGLATLDVCLLHNPEYFLSDAKNRKLSIEAAALQDLRTTFYQRLQQAFVYFEKQVAAGRLQYYGVSSNTCTTTPDDPEATSLSHMLEAAHAAAQELGQTSHHFHVLQLPMNLFESGAILTPNTGTDNKHTVLELAQQRNIAVLVNRPFNAIPTKHAGMIRLADPQAERPETTFDEQIAKVRALEEEYVKEIAPLVPLSDKGISAHEFFKWADELSRLRPALKNLEHWDQIENQMIAPHANQVFQVLTRQLTGEKEAIWDTWRRRYVPEFLSLLKVLRMESAEKSAKKIHELREIIDPLLPASQHDEPFSRKALWVLASTPGITSVLNGMRKTPYVEDSMTMMRWEPISNPRKIFEALSP
ncbi:aldo/keto reductase [Nitrospira sp. M1]